MNGWEVINAHPYLASFVIVIGLWVSFNVVGNVIRLCWSRLMRCLMVRKHGWPPPHLDADGDFLRRGEQ